MAASEHNFAAFLRDRAGGYEAELWLIDFLASKGYGAERFDDQNTTFDVRRSDGVTYEVKRDHRAFDSFNSIYVEILNGYKPSGILTSTADWWVHLIGDAQHPGEALFFKTNALRKLALDQKPLPKLVPCGNGPSHVLKVATSIARAAASAIVPHGLA